MPKLLNGQEDLHIDRNGLAVGDLSVNDIIAFSAGGWGGGATTSNATVGAGTLTAAQMTGASQVYLVRSGSTAAYADTTDTAANIIAALTAKLGTLYKGTSYILRIVNSVAFVDTLTGGTGVTITGTNTVPASGWREFLVSVTGINTVSMTSIGSGTN